MNELQRTSSSALLTLASLVVIITGLKFAAPLIGQFLMALFIAVICTPSIRWMESKRIPRAIAIFVVLLVVLIFVYLVIALVGDSITAFNANKDYYVEQFNGRLQEAVSWLIELGMPLSSFDTQSLLAKIDIMSLVTRVVGGVSTLFGDFFIVFLSVMFLLAETTSFPAKFKRAFSNSTEKLVHVNHVLSKIRHYLAIKAVTSLITGVLVSVSLVIIGVEFPYLWGMLAFLLNFIPSIGSLIASVPALILALVQLGFGGFAWTGLAYLVINNLVGNLLEPKLMGRMLGLSTFVTFASLILWGFVFGPIGMFLSVPLTMAIKIALDTSQNTRWLGILLGPEDEAEESAIIESENHS
jgi:predicted PurR-regulated permease PerM